MDKIVALGVKKKFRLKQSQKANRSSSASNEVEVLNGLNLRVREGEFLVLVGPSGSGKSVFLDIIGGLTTASGGAVYIDDKLVDGPSSKSAYVFQQYALFPWRTALSNIEFGMENQGIQKEERTDRAQKWMQKFGLSGFEDRFPYQLSGGMQQRVAIARALDRVVVVTARPAEIKEIIEIDLPRPRDANTRSSCEFTANRHKVWEALKLEVSRAQQESQLAAAR